MGVADRIILTLYTFFLAFISLFIVLMAMGWGFPLEFIRTSLLNPNGRWAVGVLGTAFFVVSIRLLYYGFRRRGPSQTVVHETALGEVRITLGAVENLVKRVARQVKGVRDIRTSVGRSPEGITVNLRAVVSPEVSIPEVSDQVQNAVKNYVRHVVGVEVAEIKIYIDNITSEARRGRLE